MSRKIAGRMQYLHLSWGAPDPAWQGSRAPQACRGCGSHGNERLASPHGSIKSSAECTFPGWVLTRARAGTQAPSIRTGATSGMRRSSEKIRGSRCLSHRQASVRQGEIPGLGQEPGSSPDDVCAGESVSGPKPSAPRGSEVYSVTPMTAARLRLPAGDELPAPSIALSVTVMLPLINQLPCNWLCRASLVPLRGFAVKI